MIKGYGITNCNTVTFLIYKAELLPTDYQKGNNQ